MNYNIYKPFLIIFSVLLLSSCSLLFPEKRVTPTTWVLNSIPCHVQYNTCKKRVLLVNVPEAKPLYNTTHIIYSLRPFHVAYYSRNEWAETVPQMLHPLLVQTLQNTYYFKSIALPPFIGPYDYSLNTQIVALLMDFSHCPGILQFCLRAQIVKNSNNKIVATKEFSVTEPILQRSPYGGVIAANKATARMLEEISYFILDTI